MQYLLDTNAVIRHFAQLPSLGKEAKKIIESAEKNQNTLLVSVITLMEILYLAEKKRIPVSLLETVKLIQTHPAYIVIDLTVDIVLEAEKVDFYELHDRMILATAKYLSIPIISSDEKFLEVPDLKVIW